MTGSVKPAGVYLAGGIILAVTVARTRYIGLGLGLGLVSLHLVRRVRAVPAFAGERLAGQLKAETVLESLPVAFLFLVAFCAYIGWSFEDGAASRSARGARSVRHIRAAPPTAR